MTWPTTTIPTANMDAGTDSPAAARAELLQQTQQVNQMRDHVSTFAATLLDDADAAAARATLGGTVVGSGVFTAADAAAARATLGAAAIETGEVYPVGCLVFAFQDNTPAAIAGYGQVNTGANLRPAGVIVGGGLFIRAAAIGVGTWRCLGMGGNSTGGGNGNTIAALWQRVS